MRTRDETWLTAQLHLVSKEVSSWPRWNQEMFHHEISCTGDDENGKLWPSKKCYGYDK